MICLIRRFHEFNARALFDLNEDETEETSEESEIWEAARNLGSEILETLGIESNFCY